jgi:RecJ-like exonuclease
MAEAHCDLCAAAGYRSSCDLCGAIVFDPVTDARTFEICQECLDLIPEGE